MTNVTLNVKISSELKEKVRLYAEEKQETLGAVTEELLTKALELALEDHDAVEEDEVDNQHTEEKRVAPLSDKEIKTLRKLLKKKK